MSSVPSSFEFRIPDEDDPFYDALRYFRETANPFPVTKEEWKKTIPYLIQLIQEAINHRPKNVIESYWRHDSQSPACSYSTYSFEWEKSYGLEHILSTAAPIHDTAIQSGYIPPDLFEDYPLGRLPFVSANKEGYDPDQYPQQKYDDGRKAMSYGFESIKMNPPPVSALLPRHIYKAWTDGLLGPVRITMKHVPSANNTVNLQSHTDSSVNNLTQSMTRSLYIEGSVASSNASRRRRFTRPV